MAITIEPLGGLGNQLFVYATGLSVATRLGVELVADLRNFVGYDWHKYELESFESRLPIVEAVSRKEAKLRYQNFALQIRRRSRGLIAAPTPGLVVEMSTCFEPDILRVGDGTRLRGYFQSWRYFEEISSEVRSRVNSVRSPSDWYLEQMNTLAERGPWVSVHVRRGNYVSIPQMGLVTANYYVRALELLKRLVGPIRIVVFSDDPVAAQKMFEDLNFTEVEYVTSPADSPPLETLLLMSIADHKIIGNSSFSWWAAWLGDRDTQQVIYPRPWLDDPAHNDRDLHPPTWLGIGRLEGMESAT